MIIIRCGKWLRLFLEPAGHEVLEAANGKIALHIQKKMPADLVVTNILMPEMQSVEFIMNLRKVDPHVKIIAISRGGGGSAGAGRVR